MLPLFVRLELFDADHAAGMLTWPHSGVHVHTAVWGPADDRAFATRLARYCARSPVALERRAYDRTAKAVTYRSDKSEGPTAGTETVDPLECLARVLVRIPDKGHVTTRHDGWYANRPRGMRDKAALARSAIPPYPRRIVGPLRLEFLSRDGDLRPARRAAGYIGVNRNLHAFSAARIQHGHSSQPSVARLLLIHVGSVCNRNAGYVERSLVRPQRAHRDSTRAWADCSGA
ncbi:MAG: transposase [Gemmatimonas sp.]|nr:transposase [Gemmatimonas sp.]